MKDHSLKVTCGDATMLYATSHGSYTVRAHLRLDHRIDGEKLRSAVDKTAQRYPYFCVYLKRNAHEYYYEVNSDPVALLHTKKAVNLGSPETNGHIWAVCYEEDNLYVDFFHGRSDGTGLYSLIAHCFTTISMKRIFPVSRRWKQRSHRRKPTTRQTICP